MRTATPVIVFIVLLAGCGGSPTGSATYPSGLSESGIQDGYALADAHQSRLEGTSFEREVQTTIIHNDTGNTLLNQSISATYLGDHSYYMIHYEVAAANRGIFGRLNNGTLTYFANGSVVAVKRVIPEADVNGTSILTEPNGNPTPPTKLDSQVIGTPTATRGIASRLQKVSPGTVTWSGSGYTIESETVNASYYEVATLHIENPTSVMLTAHVTPDGFVESYDFSVTGEIRGTPVTAHQTVEFNDVGSADIGDPPWFETPGSEHNS